MVVDASIHGTGLDSLLSMAYSWETRAGAYGDIQYVLPGKVLLESEANMEDYVAELARAAKLERVSTYRMAQAISHIIYQLTNGAKSLDASSKRPLSIEPPPRLLFFPSVQKGFDDMFFSHSPSRLLFFERIQGGGSGRAVASRIIWDRVSQSDLALGHLTASRRCDAQARWAG